MSLWRRVLGKRSERPWEQGPPLFNALQHYDGDPDFELPDQPEFSQSELQFAGGALDGIFTHHTGWSDEAKKTELLNSFISALQRLIATNGDEARAALYNIFLGEGIVTHADALIERVVSQRKIRRNEVTPHARWLVHNAAHREPLKMGIVLLGLSGNEDDLADLKVVARHDEFALYAAVAASNIVEDPTDIWWEMAAHVHGWGKIHLVERLGKHAGGRPDLQAWLLRHGCQNDIMDEYLAFTCATAGDLAGALAGGNTDDALIDGACRILGALLAGGPAEDIEKYSGGVFAMMHLFGLLSDRCDRLTRLEFVCSVHRWLEWPSAPGTSECPHTLRDNPGADGSASGAPVENARPASEESAPGQSLTSRNDTRNAAGTAISDAGGNAISEAGGNDIGEAGGNDISEAGANAISEAAGNDAPEDEKWERRGKLGWTDATRASLADQCDRIIRQPQWPALVRRAYTGEDQILAWSVSAAVGVDLWDDAFARLQRDPLNSTLYYHLTTSDDNARLKRVIEFAEQSLPLASIATGPNDHFGFGPEYEPHHCLDFLLQAMLQREVFSDTLVAAALRSPMTRNRNIAAAALMTHPPAEWGGKTRAALVRTAGDECDEKLRARLIELIKTRDST